MEDFRKSIVYDGELPRPHSELADYLESEKPSREGSFSDLARKYLTFVGGGLATGLGATEGLENFGLLEMLGSNDQMALLLGPPLAGATAGAYASIKMHEDERQEYIKDIGRWRRARDMERSREDFSRDLENLDFVVVRDYLTGDGEPIERTGEVASALYKEAEGLHDTQYFEEVMPFPEIDYQVSLFSEGQPLRSFYMGKGLSESIRDSHSEMDPVFEQNMDGAVSLEEYR
ncbi:hypothetical protein AQV86_05405 [Nanohaloarchaea archaeon SG9]|nr:hypothetical protein AQV86_05405 [Nanohaloarchaea archaeon SG9]